MTQGWGGKGRGVSVGVLIDLPWRSAAGGHVKCWEQLAQAALALEGQLDLTLHFLGDCPGQTVLAPHVRYQFHRPRWGSDRLPFLRDVADQTDLAPFHPGLGAALARHDVFHATHQLFSFGKTARIVAQRQHKPLVASIHTDVPHYTELYATAILKTQLGERGLGGQVQRLLTETWQFPQGRRRAMAHQLQGYWSHCDHVWVSRPQDQGQVGCCLPGDRISHLRRGIDTTLFHPRHRDRLWLQRTYGIAREIPLVLFVGRLNVCKNVMVVAETLRHLLDQGLVLQGMFVGLGPLIPAIKALLGDRVLLPGQLDATDLSPLYASADLFLFPSTTEVYGNVVLEARASGLPVVITNEGGTQQLVQQSGEDGLCIPGTDPVHWAAVLAPLLRQRDRLQAMGWTAHRQVVATGPSWQRVLEEDLLPVWQRLGGVSSGSGAGARGNRKC